MNREWTMRILVTGASVIGLTISVIPWVLSVFFKQSNFYTYFYLFGFDRWGWFAAICFMCVALFITMRWKLGSSLFRKGIIFFFILAIISASMWLLALITLSRFRW